jgi:phage shock protein PspC (stress-responsive transcriptional regulator)
VQQLYKSRKNKVLDGVCGGIAEYFKVDPIIVRLIWVLATIFGAHIFGVVAYFIAAVIIPPEPKKATSSSPPEQTNKEEGEDKDGDGEAKNNEPISEKEPIANGKNPGDKELEEIDSEERKRKFSLLLGLILISLGAFLLIERFVDLNLRVWLSTAIGNFWPVLLIALGVFLLSRRN